MCWINNLEELQYSTQQHSNLPLKSDWVQRCKQTCDLYILGRYFSLHLSVKCYIGSLVNSERQISLWLLLYLLAHLLLEH